MPEYRAKLVILLFVACAANSVRVGVLSNYKGEDWSAACKQSNEKLVECNLKAYNATLQTAKEQNPVYDLDWVPGMRGQARGECLLYCLAPAEIRKALAKFTAVNRAQP